MQVETLWFGKTRLRHEKNTDKNMKKLAKPQASPIFIEKFKNRMELKIKPTDKRQQNRFRWHWQCGQSGLCHQF